MLTRRRLLRSTVQAAAIASLSRSLPGRAATSLGVVKLTAGSAEPSRLPSNFTGLGYEMSSVATPGLLSATNRRYVQLVRALGSGVIRVGGIVADYTRYVAKGPPLATPKNTVLAHQSLLELSSFLGATEWSAIWSVNFAQGSLDDAVTEAKAVAAVLGPRVLAFEIGNEVENYSKGDAPFRKPPYSYEDYRSEYRRWQSRILQAVPGARFAAPDTAASVEWVERMAKDARGDVQLLTTHYYRGGQKQGTADQLLQADPGLTGILRRLQVAARESDLPWRMCETNSFFGGGRPGVSDTFVGALWVLDFMLLLALHGCSGVNIETGVNQLGFVSSYSPIQDDGRGVNRAGAPYYGMLAFAAARRDCAEIRPVDVPGSAASLTAYLLGSHGERRSAVLINRGDEDMQVSVGGLGLGRCGVMRLLSPAVDSTTNITFAGAEVSEDGRWVSRQVDRLTGGEILLPRRSAAVLRNDRV